MTFSKSLEKAGRIDIGLYLPSVGSSVLNARITLAILSDPGNIPVDNEMLNTYTRGWTLFWGDWWIISMDI